MPPPISNETLKLPTCQKDSNQRIPITRLVQEVANTYLGNDAVSSSFIGGYVDQMPEQAPSQLFSLHKKMGSGFTADEQGTRKRLELMGVFHRKPIAPGGPFQAVSAVSMLAIHCRGPQVQEQCTGHKAGPMTMTFHREDSIATLALAFFGRSTMPDASPDMILNAFALRHVMELPPLCSLQPSI